MWGRGEGSGTNELCRRLIQLRRRATSRAPERRVQFHAWRGAFTPSQRFVLQIRRILRTRAMAAMAAASQAALSLSTSFAALSLQEPHKRLASVSSSTCRGSALRCAALTMGLPVGRRFVAAAPVVRAAMAEAAELESPEMEERRSLEAWVKQQLPGGFAAARLIGTGRRKTAVARVVLVEGSGKIVINNRTAQDYLQGNPLWLQAVKYPLASLGYETKYDIIVRTEGGGLSAQAQAILLGVARALIVANQANRDPLKKQGLLTRDSRIVERKKYGLKKARKAPQYSKR